MIRGCDPRRYYARYPLRHPAHTAIRRAGERIEAAAARHFRGTLVDIGCGDAWKRDLVGRHVEGYVGIDHPDTLHDPSVVDRTGSAYALPARDGEFDCALCTSVLEHLENPAAALREAWRVLKPGGTALYTAPQFWPLHEPPRDFYRYTRFGLEHLFRTAGFDVVEITPLSGFWLTIGCLLNYRLRGDGRRSWLRVPRQAAIAVANLLWRLVDRRRSDAWTWAYMVVVRKP